MYATHNNKFLSYDGVLKKQFLCQCLWVTMHNNSIILDVDLYLSERTDKHNSIILDVGLYLSERTEKHNNSIILDVDLYLSESTDKHNNSIILDVDLYLSERTDKPGRFFLAVIEHCEHCRPQAAPPRTPPSLSPSQASFPKQCPPTPVQIHIPEQHFHPYPARPYH